MRVAHQVGDAGTEAHALVTLAWARYRYSEWNGPGRGVSRGAREIAGRAGDYNALLRAAISESDSLEGAGRHERGRRGRPQGRRATPSRTA